MEEEEEEKEAEQRGRGGGGGGQWLGLGLQMNPEKGHVPTRTGVTLVLMRKLPIAVRDFITLIATLQSCFILYYF